VKIAGCDQGYALVAIAVFVASPHLPGHVLWGGGSRQYGFI
jgi:hypothetical protein